MGPASDSSIASPAAYAEEQEEEAVLAYLQRNAPEGTADELRAALRGIISTQRTSPRAQQQQQSSQRLRNSGLVFSPSTVPSLPASADDTDVAHRISVVAVHEHHPTFTRSPPPKPVRRGIMKGGVLH